VRLASDTWTRDFQWDDLNRRFPIAEGAVEALNGLPQLGEVHSERLLAIAEKLESQPITSALFGVLITNGTAKSRAAVVTAALKSDSNVVRRLAAHALIAHQKLLDNSLVGQVQEEDLTKGPPRVAFALSILVGARGDIDQVMRSARSIAAVSQRRALLIPLYLFFRDQNIEAAKNILGLLSDEPLAIDLRRAVDEGHKLPQDALEPLKASLVGEILVNEIVAHLDLVGTQL
jgi:hypothetical protein